MQSVSWLHSIIHASWRITPSCKCSFPTFPNHLNATACRFVLCVFLLHLHESHVVITIACQITEYRTQTEIPHSDVNPFEELIVILMKAQVLTEDQLNELTLKKGKEKVRERVIQLIQSGRKKSAHSSVLGKREAPEANVFSSPSPPRKNAK